MVDPLLFMGILGLAVFHDGCPCDGVDVVGLRLILESGSVDQLFY
jgi:hypothetical protein